MSHKRDSVLMAATALLIAGVMLLALSIVGCPSSTVSCTRAADGSVSCTVETHKDGNHNKPVPITPPPQ